MLSKSVQSHSINSTLTNKQTLNPANHTPSHPLTRPNPSAKPTNHHPQCPPKALTGIQPPLVGQTAQHKNPQGSTSKKRPMRLRVWLID
jgi:hypothetical protein